MQFFSYHMSLDVRQHHGSEMPPGRSSGIFFSGVRDSFKNDLQRIGTRKCRMIRLLNERTSKESYRYILKSLTKKTLKFKSYKSSFVN